MKVSTYTFRVGSGSVQGVFSTRSGVFRVCSVHVCDDSPN